MMRPLVANDAAQCLQLPWRVAQVGKELGLGRKLPHHGGTLFSRDEERAALAELERRRQERLVVRRQVNAALRSESPARRVVAAMQDIVTLDSRVEIVVALRAIEMEALELSLRVKRLTALVLCEQQRGH